MKFDKPTARKIRDAMQEALDKADVNGVTIKVGNCSFTEGEATYKVKVLIDGAKSKDCLLYTSPSPRDRQKSRMPSSA